MTNGRNDWGVEYSSIRWFESQFCASHKNVSSVERSRDIVFAVHRKNQLDTIEVLLVNVYAFGIADYFRATAEFPNVKCIVQNGKWNKFTGDALSQASCDEIGLFTPSELYAALWKDNPVGRRKITKGASSVSRRTS
jgi:hypothetical protein